MRISGAFGAGWARLGLLIAMVCIGLASPAQAQETQAADDKSGGALTVAAKADALSLSSSDSIPPRIETSAFAARSPFGSAKLSPDGLHLALSATADKQTSISIYNIDAEKIEHRVPIGAGAELEWFRWAGPHRVLLGASTMGKVYGIKIRYTRTLVVDIRTGDLAFVGKNRMGIMGDHILHVDPAGDWILLSLQSSALKEPEVWRMLLDRSGDPQDMRIQSRKTGVWSWYADTAGVVRLGLGKKMQTLKVWYRPNGDEDFQVIAKLKEDSKDDDLWDALKIVAGRDEGYLLREDTDGRIVLRQFNYATREDGAVIHRNESWDLTDYELDDDGNPLAVYFTDDRGRTVWLNEDMARTQKGLETALGGQEVWITGRATDHSRMLVWAGSETDPGTWYIYTPAAQELKILTPLRPGIDPANLARVKPVRFTARDGTMIHSYLGLPRGRDAKKLPLILMPHGGPYGVRDTLDYSDEVQLLANRGYAVLQPNFRGSGGYGEDFSTLGAGQIGRAMQDDLDDAVAWAVDQGIADPNRVCVVGASYGGYAAMWAIMRNPEHYRCAVSLAGVSDWKKQLRYDDDFMTRKAHRRFKEKIRGADEDFDLDTVSPAHQAARIGRPLLLVHGEADNRVPFRQFLYMRDALNRLPQADVEYLTFKESGHGFNSPEDKQSYYDHLLAFLAKHNPADPAQEAPSGE